MTTFLETAFGPKELGIIGDALDQWLSEHSLARSSPEAELAAAVLINLFREGSKTVANLLDAANRHKALRDLTPAAA